MANYAVEDWVSDPGSPATVAAAMETKLETIDSTKTLRLVEMVKVGNDTFRGIIIYDT